MEIANLIFLDNLNDVGQLRLMSILQKGCQGPVQYLLSRTEKEGLTNEERKRFIRYGINRADPEFWKEYDLFQQNFFRVQPVEAGFFDLNRYYPKAL